MEDREYDILNDLEKTGWWWQAGMQSVMDALLDGTITCDSRLADIGCGTGARLELYSRRCKVWGLDYHPRSVELCRARGLKNVEQGDAQQLPWSDAMFTHAICSQVLQNLPDDAGAIREAYRVLQPGGLYYISEQAYPILRSQHDVSQGAIRRYTKRRLLGLMRDVGFDIERVTHVNTTLFPLMAAVRLADKLRHPPASVRPEDSRSDLKPLPAPLNAMLRGILRTEGKIIASGRSLPFGLTIIALGRKPA